MKVMEYDIMIINDRLRQIEKRLAALENIKRIKDHNSRLRDAVFAEGLRDKEVEERLEELENDPDFIDDVWTNSCIC